MTDVLPPDVRSRVMSKIRSKSGLDARLFAVLDSLGVGYERYPSLPGRPDALVAGRVAVFADGCFWHGCGRHFRPPGSSFSGVDWAGKIAGNRRRDRRVGRALRRLGYTVVRVWEHDLRDPERATGVLLRALRRAGVA